MKNIDLETFHKKIENHIQVLASWTNDISLIKIVKSCRLKPYSTFGDTFKFDTKLERHWVDEFGNSLKIERTTPKIVFNDLSIKGIKLSTDLFYGNSIATISGNSKAILIATGEINSEKVVIVSFYGHDEYLRNFIFMYSKLTRMAPLLMGIKTIDAFFQKMVSAQTNKLAQDKLDFVLPIKIGECIVSSWPAKQDIMSCFDDKTKTIFKEIKIEW